MPAAAIALSVLLFAAAPSDSAVAKIQRQDAAAPGPASATGKPADSWIQLAAGGKLGEKYMAGRAGGRYGIGGTERRKKGRGK
jgi:hypothetical protein